MLSTFEWVGFGDRHGFCYPIKSPFLKTSQWTPTFSLSNNASLPESLARLKVRFVLGSTPWVHQVSIVPRDRENERHTPKRFSNAWPLIGGNHNYRPWLTAYERGF
jgi:hypothetical protein